jgi:hypothetical protein
VVAVLVPNIIQLPQSAWQDRLVQPILVVVVVVVIQAVQELLLSVIQVVNVPQVVVQ